jgi:hypothetical protein
MCLHTIDIHAVCIYFLFTLNTGQFTSAYILK